MLLYMTLIHVAVAVVSDGGLCSCVLLFFQVTLICVNVLVDVNLCCSCRDVNCVAVVIVGGVNPFCCCCCCCRR